MLVPDVLNLWVYYLQHQLWPWVPRFGCSREFKKMVEIGPRRVYVGYNLNNKQMPCPIPLRSNLKQVTVIGEQSEEEDSSPYLRCAWRSLWGPPQSAPQPLEAQGASEHPLGARGPARFSMRLLSLERLENMLYHERLYMCKVRKETRTFNWHTEANMWTYLSQGLNLSSAL